jgi:glucokinase
MSARPRQYTIGLDLGGTKILAGLVSPEFRVVATHKTRVDANKGEGPFLKSIFDAIDELAGASSADRKGLRAIGVGCPGMIDFDSGTVTLSPNLSFLKNYPLRKKLERRYGVPVAAENDVNTGLYGEQAFGAAKGKKHVVGIFLGTGVGGALILDGRLYRGAWGGAGEIGHTFLSLPSFVPDPNRPETVEGMLGRLTISTEAALLILKQKAPRLHGAAGYDVKKIKSRALSESARRGDFVLKDLLRGKAAVLGIALANVVNLLNPEMIVLGGGVMEAMGDMILPEAERVMRKYAMPPLVKNVRLVPAKLGDLAIVLGAARLAAERAGGKVKSA